MQWTHVSTWRALIGAGLALVLLAGLIVLVPRVLTRSEGRAPVVSSVLAPDARPSSDVAAVDGNPVELGLRFVSSVAGELVGLKYYRLADDITAHPATIWSPSGTPIATVLLPETAVPGWQTSDFVTPVALPAGHYTVSYHADGTYPADVGYFATAPHGQAVGGPLQPDPAGAGVFAYGRASDAPSASVTSTNYWVDVVFAASPFSSSSSSTSASSTASSTPSSTSSTTSFTTASSTASSTAPPGVLPPGVLPQPGEVGFLGDRGSLRVIDSVASAPPGTTWSTNTLRVDADSVTLDGVYVRGSIDFYGSGTLTVRNSVVEANGSSWSVVLSRSSAGLVNISDSTLVWPASVPAPGPTWSNGAVHGDARVTLVRDDISGTPDGVQQSGGNSTFQQNYIHDLRMIGVYPNNTHNDGLQLYGGPNTEVSYNYIELNGYDGTHQNAAVFCSDDGGGSPSVQIVGNYLSGGGYQLRLEDGTTNATVTDNTFGPIAGGFGHANLSPGASIAVWRNNIDENGAVSAP